MKKCNICKKKRQLSKFPKRGKGYGPYCIECKRKYDREYWAKTKQKRNKRKRENQKNIRIRNRKYLWNYLKEHPCIDCGEPNPIVLEFDHIKDKKIEISNLCSGSIKTLQKEINKCKIRCANCHRKKTAKDFNWYKDII